MKGLGLPSPLWSEDGVPVSMSGLVCWPVPVLLFPFQGLCEPLESFSLPSTFSKALKGALSGPEDTGTTWEHA